VCNSTVRSCDSLFNLNYFPATQVCTLPTACSCSPSQNLFIKLIFNFTVNFQDGQPRVPITVCGKRRSSSHCLPHALSSICLRGHCERRCLRWSTITPRGAVSTEKSTRRPTRYLLLIKNIKKDAEWHELHSAVACPEGSCHVAPPPRGSLRVVVTRRRFIYGYHLLSARAVILAVRHTIMDLALDGTLHRKEANISPP